MLVFLFVFLCSFNDNDDNDNGNDDLTGKTCCRGCFCDHHRDHFDLPVEYFQDERVLTLPVEITAVNDPPEIRLVPGSVLRLAEVSNILQKKNQT